VRKKNKLPKVVHKRLSRRRIIPKMYGYYDDELDTIFLDPRFSQREQFKTLLHECFHRTFPAASERDIISITNKIFPILWAQGYRKTLQ